MKLLVTPLVVLFLSTAVIAQESEAYTYLNMVQYGNNLNMAYGDGEFETINVKDERTRDKFDNRPLLKRISEFEREGWELISTEFNYIGGSTDMVGCALLRKEI